MDEIGRFLGSILDYASKYKMENVIKKIFANVSNVENLDFGENMRIVVTTIVNVVNREQFEFFDNIIEQLTTIHNFLPSIFPHKQFSMMVFGLKIKVCLYLIRKENFKLAELKSKLDLYFPKDESAVTQMTKFGLEELRFKEKNFRNFMIKLALNESKRKEYLSSHMESDYGHKFYQDIKLLVFEYLSIFEKYLPEPNIEKFLYSNNLQEIVDLPPNLVDGIKKKAITEQLLLEVLDSIFSKTSEMFEAPFEKEKDFNRSHDDINTSQDLFSQPSNQDFFHTGHLFVPDPSPSVNSNTGSQTSKESKDIFMKKLNLCPINIRRHKFISEENRGMHMLDTPDNTKKIPDLGKFLKPFHIRPCFVKLDKLSTIVQ